MAQLRIMFGRLFGRGNESGTAAIEFALFLPFLALLLSGIVELGVSAYEAMQVSNAVEAGAYAAANTTTFSAASIASATTNGAALLPGSNALTATPAPTQFCGCPSAAGSVSNLGAPPCSVTACSGSTPAGTYVQVNASLNHMAIFHTTWGLPATFTATTVIRTN